ncbi:MAG: LD-carboxypeptidase [Desulfobulbaceae bacterium]|nr:LD-carboxypeptidase [Desulfobulbaceae bacterium]
MSAIDKLILPPTLGPGDTIGLAAPAGPVIREKDFADGVKILREMGFEVKYQRDIMRRTGYLAGPDQERISELHDLWRDPEVKAIMAVRGGYGCLRLAPHLDLELLRLHPKIVIGFSDLTVLLNIIVRQTGAMALHGPMLTTLPRSDRESLASFFHAITGRLPDQIKADDLEIITGGNAQGRLVGGNLTCLSHLIGTPYEPQWEKSILLLEDVAEAPYRLDRMLSHLWEAGALRKISGLILGGFEECGDIEPIWQRALELLKEQNIPIWGNFPTGHGPANLTLPLGCEVIMDSSRGRLRFS